MKKTIAFTLSLLIFASFGAVLVSAQDKTTVPVTDKTSVPATDNTSVKPTDHTDGPPATGGITLDNPFGKTGGSLTGLLDNIFNNIVFPIGGILAVLAFIYSGFLYVTAQGNESKIQDAHKALLYTAVGTAVLLGARVISEVISGTIDQLK